MRLNDTESFNRLIWHDSKLRSLRITRNAHGSDEISLDVEMRGISEPELTAMTVVFEDAVFFFCDVDLQAKRECSDDISSAVCALNTELITKIENERLHAPAALAEYFHYSIWLIPFGGSIDIIAAGCQIDSTTEAS
jgi:hypothetical protein